MLTNLNLEKKLALGAILLLSMASCNKERNNYSYWTVDGKEYSSNKARYTSGKGGVGISTSGLSNGFSLSFKSHYPSQQGKLYLRGVENQSDYPVYNTLQFRVNGKTYMVNHDSAYIIYSIVNGQDQFVLPETKFINYTDSLRDTVVIEAVIYKPKK